MNQKIVSENGADIAANTAGEITDETVCPRLSVLDTLFDANGYRCLCFAYTDRFGVERIIPLVFAGDVVIIFPRLGELFKMLRSQPYQTAATFMPFGFDAFEIPRGSNKDDPRRMREELEKLLKDLDRIKPEIFPALEFANLSNPFAQLRLIEEIDERPDFSRLYFYLATGKNGATRSVGAYVGEDGFIKIHASLGGLFKRYFDEFADKPLATVSLDSFEGRGSAEGENERMKLSGWLTANLLGQSDSQMINRPN